MMRCRNCQLFRNAKDLLFEKWPIEQWNYIANFIHDLFNISVYSVLWYSDLKPISQEVKDKNCVFLCKKDANDYLDNNNNNNNKIQYFIKNRKYYWKR